MPMMIIAEPFSSASSVGFILLLTAIIFFYKFYVIKKNEKTGPLKVVNKK